MQRRNRPEERSVPMNYLADLHEYYEIWMMTNRYKLPCPLLVIDVSKDLSENQLIDVYKNYEDTILGKVPVL